MSCGWVLAFGQVSWGCGHLTHQPSRSLQTSAPSHGSKWWFLTLFLESWILQVGLFQECPKQIEVGALALLGLMGSA